LITEPSLHQALLESSIEIDLRDVDPPMGFKQAIEAKLTAEQQKIQAEFERQRKIILADAEAQQKVIYANGTAEAMRLIKEEVGEEGWALYYSWQELEKVAPYVRVLIIVPNAEGMPIFYTIPPEEIPSG
jgi:regulator of protease activity HflC (stomatin/prohibitin superfamily)